MGRRSAAWAAAITALLLTAAYLLTRRRQAGATPAPFVLPDVPSPEVAVADPRSHLADEERTRDEVGAKPVRPVVEPPVPVRLPSTAPAPELDPPTGALPRQQVKSQSWQRRARHTLPAQAPEATTALTTQEPDEQPLPTWLRLTIVIAALIAFFAVSLIATKRV